MIDRTDDRADETARLRVARPSPLIRLNSRPADERAAEAGDEGHRPVDPAAVATEDELGEGTDENSETEDRENEHRRTISR